MFDLHAIKHKRTTSTTFSTYWPSGSVCQQPENKNGNSMTHGQKTKLVMYVIYQSVNQSFNKEVSTITMHRHIR